MYVICPRDMNDSLGTALLEFESLAGVGVVQRGEGAGRSRVRLAAVGRQHSGDVTGTGVERRRGPRGGGQGAIQCLQQGHGLVARRDVLRRLQSTGLHAGHYGGKLLNY